MAVRRRLLEEGTEQRPTDPGARAGVVVDRLHAEVRKAMDDAPLTCTAETELDEVRRMMLERHARYMPVMNQRTLMGVISFYDVAKAVVESQDFENRMLKAYIRDWPVEEGAAAASAESAAGTPSQA